MDCKVITYINEKGGVGKSSACFNVSWELSKRGKRILMVDMDGQKANLTFFCGIEKTDSMDTIKSIFEGKDIKDVIFPLKENLDLIPATSKVAFDTTAKVSRFRKSISSIKDYYDYIMIDVNPTPGWSHYLSLSVSTHALIVMLPDITSLEANEGILETIEEIRETSNQSLQVMGILFNKHDPRTILAREVFEAANGMAESIGSSVFDVKIRNSVLLRENVGAHEGITDYSPNSTVAKDIINLVNEIESKVI